MRHVTDQRWSRWAACGLILAAFTGCAGGFVAVESGPPPERVEVVETPPGPEFVWVAGYWDWSGTEYVWVPGRWTEPPHGHRVWVRDYWEQHGRKWHHVNGHWR